MTKAITKYASRFARVLIIIFPILFAVNVLNTFNIEESEMQMKSMNVLDTLKNGNEECSSTMVINASFAILLAALWNMKKIIKIGAI
jgi:hypothetical protein